MHRREIVEPVSLDKFAPLVIDPAELVHGGFRLI
jgi:hypothetical protein